MGKFKHNTLLDERGASDPVSIVLLLVVFAGIYYGAMWTFDYMRETKDQRRIERVQKQHKTHTAGARYMSDLY